MADSTDQVPTEKYQHLPEPVRVEDTVTTQVTEPPPDPKGGRDTETEFIIRYGGG